jgi:hypothetical protein
MTKTCPFCKKHIDKSAAECPHCKRVLIEYVGNRFAVPPSHKTTVLENIKRRIATFRKRLHNTHIRLHKPSFNKNYLWIIPVIIFLVILASGHTGNLTSTDSPENAPTITTENSLPANYNRLSNGSVLSSRIVSSSGLGTLEIDNGTEDDAVAKLANTKIGVSMVTVFIRANSKFTITKIPDGTYMLYFQTGKDWDNTAKKFLYYPSFSQFTDDFQYTTTHIETYDATNTRYSTYQVTLNPVTGGTAKTNAVTESEFEKY